MDDLDRWLAEKLEPEPSMPKFSSIRQSGAGLWWIDHNEQWHPQPFFTMWNAAGRLTEAMVARGWEYRVNGPTACGQHIAKFDWPDAAPELYPFTYADTFPAAVATAARATLEKADTLCPKCKGVGGQGMNWCSACEGDGGRKAAEAIESEGS